MQSYLRIRTYVYERIRTYTCVRSANAALLCIRADFWHLMAMWIWLLTFQCIDYNIGQRAVWYGFTVGYIGWLTLTLQNLKKIQSTIVFTLSCKRTNRCKATHTDSSYSFEVAGSNRMRGDTTHNQSCFIRNAITWSPWPTTPLKWPHHHWRYYSYRRWHNTANSKYNRSVIQRITAGLFLN